MVASTEKIYSKVINGTGTVAITVSESGAYSIYNYGVVFRIKQI
jgi:hypothetical protein